MIIKCGKCQQKLKVDNKSITSNTFNIVCPACKTKNTIKIPPDIYQKIQDEQKPVQKTNESTVIQESNFHHAGNTNPDELGWLIRHTEKMDTKTFTLKAGANFIGRYTQSSQPDIPIENDKYVSRKHCKIEVKKIRGIWMFILSDLGSTNGTYINGKGNKLLKQDEIYLKEGDTIQVGRTKFVFKSAFKNQTASSATNTVIGTDYTKTIIA
jgi:phage FluMu protein Com